MKGVESIIGAYLALVIIVGVLTTLYLYVDYARQGISSQFTEYIDRQLLLVYPPILSLSYVNDTWFKLSVTPYIPVNLDEIVVRNLDGELIYSISVKEVVSNTREYLLSINETPLIIQLLTSSGEIIYYLPRNDPKLLNAPENIKLKPYIDQELLEYLKTSSRTTIRDDPYSETSFITLLNQLGYKVFVAKTTTLNDSSIVENLLLNGPLLCPYKNNVANPYNTLCNIQLWPSHYTYPGFISITSFLTYRYNTSYWWFDDYDYFYLKTNLSSYIPTVNLSYNQILRVIKAKPGLYQLNYSIDGYIHVRNHLTTYATGLVVVVYILPGNIDLQKPILLAPSEINSVYWLDRIVLYYIPPHTSLYGPGWNNIYYFTINDTVIIDTRSYGYNDYIIALGLEITTIETNTIIKSKIIVNVSTIL